jgi:uracil-DNA glycosylase family protein
MAPRTTAAGFLPDSRDLDELRQAATRCRGCDLWAPATQVVFGHGPSRARVVLVGEMPGDKEDLAGEPFVGPAGRVLDQALDQAGIERAAAYATNAVKHFKFEERGKRRIHKTPTRTEVVSCRPWLDAELDAIHPEVVVLLGATAAKAIMGPSFRVTVDRGRDLDSDVAEHVVATIHPSQVLRVPPEDRDRALAGLVADLRVVAALLD